VGRTSDARERLIEAATSLIWQSSCAAVGVDAICEEAGVKKGSFYHFFASKDDLVVAALDTHWEKRRLILDGLFSPSLPPLERLRRYLSHSFVRQTAIRKQYGRVLGCFHNSVGTECIQTAPAIAAKVQEVISMHRRYLETTLRDAQAARVLRRGDPAADAQTLYAYVAGTIAQARIHDDPEILKTLPATGFALLGIVDTQPPPNAPKARRPAARKGARV
jgi:TetR/AcrR family transcriptional repressor of nem operon